LKDAYFDWKIQKQQDVCNNALCWILILILFIAYFTYEKK